MEVMEMRESLRDTIFVYGLINPVTHEVKYVGRTSALRARYREHCRGASRSTKAWVSTLPSDPLLVVLETVRADGDGSTLQLRANDCETKWLKRFRLTVINQRLRDNSPQAWDALVNHV
jgi:hypothetical protein